MAEQDVDQLCVSVVTIAERVVSRDSSGFQKAGVSVINPWD